GTEPLLARLAAVLLGCRSRWRAGERDRLAAELPPALLSYFRGGLGPCPAPCLLARLPEPLPDLDGCEEADLLPFGVACERLTLLYGPEVGAAALANLAELVRGREGDRPKRFLALVAAHERGVSRGEVWGEERELFTALASLPEEPRER